MWCRDQERTGVRATHLTKRADVSGKYKMLDSRFHGNDRQRSEEQKRETASRFLFAMGFVRREMDKKEIDIILREPRKRI